MAIGWLTRSAADVPAGDGWLGARERDALARLRVPKRRDDWRLGRWAAKAALAAWLGVETGRLEVLAAADGAPDAWLDGEPAPVSVSLSHRAGRALAAVTDPPAVVGCDLELVEPRSPAFIGDFLAPAEQALVAVAPPDERARLANLAWSAKEAAAKVRREGLRLDVRQAVMHREGPPEAGGWAPLSVRWADGSAATEGWWRAGGGFVLVVAAARAPAPPRALDRHSP
ncbi:MAG TPA: 4'-phosphopantetheinyl transferase superfamily protein [Solirubrobacteraceae bacterium]|jgi:4'-phosphopantetheinyl transferase